MRIEHYTSRIRLVSAVKVNFDDATVLAIQQLAGDSVRILDNDRARLVRSDGAQSELFRGDWLVKFRETLVAMDDDLFEVLFLGSPEDVEELSTKDVQVGAMSDGRVMAYKPINTGRLNGIGYAVGEFVTVAQIMSDLEKL